jgi:hypothetical protein
MCVAAFGVAQTQRRQQQKSATQGPVTTTAEPRSTIYQGRDTWYDFLLKQFNPDNLDYGRWMEQRRAAFLEARARNPYFGYGMGMTIGLLLMALMATKLWIDNRRTLSVTAEMMADLYNHDLYSRAAAREAIERYNAHIERCNRVFEDGVSAHTSIADGEVEQLRAELQRTAEGLATAERDKRRLEEELRAKSALVADLSVRLDALRKNGGSHGPLVTPADPGSASSDLVQHINQLQQQLYAERQKNRQLKGA